MLILVSGGAASGKSAFAEGLAAAHPGAPRLYIATMRLWDAECEARADRHRRQRAGKGFTTVECPENLADLDLPAGGTALLEDLSNLCANEYFGARGREGTADRICAGLALLSERCSLAVVVTNELFSDGAAYDPDTAAYLDCLAGINRRTAALAGAVYEVVCGIPVCWKEARP